MHDHVKGLDWTRRASTMRGEYKPSYPIDSCFSYPDFQRFQIGADERDIRQNRSIDLTVRKSVSHPLETIPSAAFPI